jgi:hypothetical protein
MVELQTDTGVLLRLPSLRLNLTGEPDSNDIETKLQQDGEKGDKFTKMYDL